MSARRKETYKQVSLTASNDYGSVQNWQQGIAPIRQLRPAFRNARTHSRKQIRQIADSIRSFGWTNPILIDEKGNVIAGHGRVRYRVDQRVAQTSIAVKIFEQTAKRVAFSRSQNRLKSSITTGPIDQICPRFSL